MNTRLILGGLKSFFPVSLEQFKGTGGTDNSAYCYAIWLRHLALIAEHLGRTFTPETVVEIGPGDSIGVGLAAVLSVANRYVGLDVVEHSNPERNLRVLDDLVQLYRTRAPVPNEADFSRMYPRLASYDFPSHLFSDQDLKWRISDENLSRLRSEVININGSANQRINYCSPWSADSLTPESVDLVISQAALEDIKHSSKNDQLATSINAMARWLKPNGVMSHQIDFSCPGGITPWNHHWIYSDVAWKLICGRRPYYVNRVSFSQYVSLFENVGLNIIGVQPISAQGLPRSATARSFKHLPAEDFLVSGALIISVKA